MNQKAPQDQIMEAEDERILEILADTCPVCLERTKDGVEKGCLLCVARDVMNT